MNDRQARKTIASSGPPMPSSTPAIAGAIRTLPFSAQLETTLAAVSSIGLRTMLGSSADCAGRGTVMPRLMAGAMANTVHDGASRAIAAATAPMATPCTR